MATTPSPDSIVSRNASKVYLAINGSPIGRVQSIRQDITNNVQVLDELGSQFAVELKKGITHYTFSIAKFFCRADAFEAIKLGQIFSLAVQDRSNVANFLNDPLQQTAGGTEEQLEYFERCAITSISRDFTVGQAVVGLNASVVAIGQGL